MEWPTVRCGIATSLVIVFVVLFASHQEGAQQLNVLEEVGSPVKYESQGLPRNGGSSMRSDEALGESALDDLSVPVTWNGEFPPSRFKEDAATAPMTNGDEPITADPSSPTTSTWTGEFPPSRRKPAATMPIATSDDLRGSNVQQQGTASATEALNPRTEVPTSNDAAMAKANADKAKAKKAVVEAKKAVEKLPTQNSSAERVAAGKAIEKVAPKVSPNHAPQTEKTTAAEETAKENASVNVARHISFADEALARAHAVGQSSVVAEIKDAEEELPRAQVAAKSATMHSAQLQRAIKEQQGVVQKLSAVIEDRERRSQASRVVKQDTKSVLRGSLRAAPKATPVAEPPQPPPPPIVPSKKMGHMVRTAVHTAVHTAVDTAMSQASAKLERLVEQENQLGGKVDAIASQLSGVKSARTNAAAILARAKHSAASLIQHAKKEDAIATAAAALSKTNTAGLQKIDSIAHAALRDIDSVDTKVTQTDPMVRLHNAQLKQQAKIDENSLKKIKRI